MPGVSLVGSLEPERSADERASAEATAARRFTYGGETRTFPGRIDWQPRDASPAWCLEHNALDVLYAVGIAGATARDASARRAWYGVASETVRSWVAQTRSGRGVAWQPAALARRIPNLLGFLTVFAPELRDDCGTRDLVLDSMYRQAQTLAAAIEGHPGDPVLVAAGRALFAAGRWFDGLEARGWADAGAALLWGQLREQVHEDGGHRDRSTESQCGLLGEYLEVLAALRAADEELPVWSRKRVKGMADCLLRLMHPDGSLARLQSRAVPLRLRPARELLAVAAVVLDEPALKIDDDLPGVWPLLLLGDSGHRAYGAMSRGVIPSAPRALRRTGYYVLPGVAGDCMFVDGGALGTGGAPGSLGYELSVGGERMVVAPGPAAGHTPWVDAFLASPRARNVVVARDDEASSTEATGAVFWSIRDGLAAVSATVTRPAGDAGGLRHRRVVCGRPGAFWMVLDEVVGAGEWAGESLVHLHPDVVVHATCAGRPLLALERSRDARLLLTFAGARHVAVQQGVAGALPQGWYVNGGSSARPAPVVALGVSGRLPLLFGYAIVPRAAEGPVLELDRDEFQLRARLRVPGREYALVAEHGEVGLRERRL